MNPTSATPPAISDQGEGSGTGATRSASGEFSPVMCNECTNRSNRMFKYNGDKQDCIADLSAGTYRELVEAAQACKVAIIHPGKPWNPNKPDLEELLRRAAPFR